MNNAKFANRASADIEKAQREQLAAEAHVAAQEKAVKDRQEAEAADNDNRLVKTMTKKTWKKSRERYTSGKKQFMVKFYLPTCKTCQDLAPRFEAVATAAKDDENTILGAVDCEAQKDVCTEEGIPSYPVIITYNADNMAGEWPGAVFEKVSTVEVMAAELGIDKSKLTKEQLALDDDINRKVAEAAAKEKDEKKDEKKDEL